MSEDRLLVLNAGSSSIKFAVYPMDGESPLWRGQADGLGGNSARLHISDGKDTNDETLTLDRGDHAEALQRLLDWLDANVGHRSLRAVGHRVVHGGTRHSEPLILDADRLEELDDLSGLAPLHQPHNLAAARHLMQRRPDLPQVACFDTAFHRSQPWVAQQFALPGEWQERGVLRYGFHGLSYEYIAGRLREEDPVLARGRVVVAHLGNGASLCGMKDGRSQATSMGFTALDGLPMGQRCGALDPGVVLYLIQQQGMSVEAVQDLLYHRSGLLGMSGISHDMRELLASGEASAARAVDVFCYRAAREIASLAAALGGLDGLVFTAGIGENCAPVRRAIVEYLAWLDFDLDEPAKETNAARIHSSGSRPVYVLPTDEQAVIARHTRHLLTTNPSG
ncbi:acetate/propionate family kinase [Natronospira bacteriovora]|uniref:Acetate kinase n=1 Tax=Natronospira bacteriovora TaxID=3069753 RepID=A0ABU0W943_9GAMM|nr:acetate/propionate family kinase [Natronospira sp. AB-CW4]MDQ2070472.1 acetate/propionate family kinase [Natronospira sp. AB-CW4]